MSKELSQKILDIHKRLIDEIKKHDHLYYEKDDPIVNDSEYDYLRRKVEELEKKHEQLRSLPYSFASKIGTINKPSRKNKITHMRKMMSLDNVFNADELYNFVLNLKVKDPVFCCEPKIDGLSVSIFYNNSKFVSAATRGDGVSGEDVSNNIFFVDKVPTSIPYNGPIEIRGEVYISKKNFIALNKKREAKGKSLFANSRNCAAGSLRHLDPNEMKERGLSLLVFGFAIPNFSQKAPNNFESMSISPMFMSQFTFLHKVREWGFYTTELLQLAKTYEELLEYYNNIRNKRNDLSFDIDGTVYKLDDINSWLDIGTSSRAPKYAIAHKFDTISELTCIDEVIWQVGRLGNITPVALVTPVSVAGAVVKRSTLHNIEQIRKKNLKKGDFVLIIRSGEVIPKIEVSLSALKRLEDQNSLDTTSPDMKCDYEKYNWALFQIDGKKHDTENINPPTSCPVCKVATKMVECHIICPNTKCDARILGRLKHFVSKKAFNIEGLSTSHLETLFEKGIIKEFANIFSLSNDIKSQQKIKEKDGWGEKSLNNLIENIQRSKNISLHKFIYALGIPHIGFENASLLATHCGTLTNFLQNAATMDFSLVPGLGPKANESTHYYLANNMQELENLVIYLKVQDMPPVESKQTIVFTGKLNYLSRTQAHEIAFQIGFSPKLAVTKTTNLLIIGENPGSKLKKAEKLGIKIMSEKEWLESNDKTKQLIQ